MSEQVCAYEKCSERFTPKRPHQRFHHESCRYAQWELDKAREEAADSGQRVESLDEVRAKHEESKGRWTVIVREHLNRTLVLTGYVSAEDFDALGIPPEHSNLANAQMGSYSKRGFMEAISWHRSKKPSRKSGKVWVHKLTEKGREQLSPLVGSSSGAPGGTGVATARSGENPFAGHDAREAGDSGDSPDTQGVVSGEESGVGPTQPQKLSASPPAGADTDVGSPDSLIQLEGVRKAPSMYDPMEDAA